jgi:small-conductance mechanosensitive channel
MEKNLWFKINSKLILCAVLFIGALIISSHYGNVRQGTFDHKLASLFGVIIFVIFANAFLRVLAMGVRKTIIYRQLGVGRGAALQFILLLFGYLAVLITALDRLGIPVGRILLGSAVLGIILGVAAQQALANFFASIVLIISHPFTVGEHVTITSGSLGGKYIGTIVDIGLTHTHLREKNGNLVYLPNSTLLIGATIRVQKDPSQYENQSQ